MKEYENQLHKLSVEAVERLPEDQKAFSRHLFIEGFLTAKMLLGEAYNRYISEEENLDFGFFFQQIKDLGEKEV